MNAYEEQGRLLAELQTLGGSDDQDGALRDSFTPAEWELNAQKTAALALDPVEAQAYRNVVAAIMLRDAAGYTWRFDGQSWQRWQGETWEPDTPPESLTPLPVDLKEVPEQPEVEDAFPLCPACSTPNAARAFYCLVCGADLTQARPDDVWHCPHCERWNVETAPFCTECGTSKTTATVQANEVEATLGDWQKDVAAKLTAGPEALQTPAPEPVAEPEPASPACMRCGQPVSEGTRFCDACLASADIPANLDMTSPPDLLPFEAIIRPPRETPAIQTPAREEPRIEAVASPSASEEPSRICSNCGHANDAALSFCTACGTTLAPIERTESPVLSAEALQEPAVAPEVATQTTPGPTAEVAAAPNLTPTLCPHCGSALPETGRFCVGCGAEIATLLVPQAGSAGLCANCGARLADGTNFCATCGSPVVAAPPAQASLVCSNCRAELQPGTRFCVNCGTPVTG